ncbi:RNA polymerase factor sigma-54 [Vagococcus vulneris]|uniref:RNA polymerase sigma-54 factor n=1 Tax=Vagococcus vulneris TaxID=1977869 RepID=A0A430A1J1_9ENTE|nr:RNA polymerase factor sigma-54 [Vagococcus vulneris]RSU00253.1 RNA polymerase sigma-54 factor [Vagococcus vulneris]
MRFEQHISQQQKQSQKLMMSQQMQQSIKMLQLNTPDLLSFLENKALENPLIEVTAQTDDYSESNAATSYNGENKHQEWMNQLPNETGSLFEHVINQIHLNYRDTYLRQLTLYLVEYIDSNGYLTITMEEAMDQSGANYIEMLDALRLLQMLEPAGVGARNLQECLMLQTERDNTAPELAYFILEEFFEELASRKWSIIEKELVIPAYEVQKVFDYIQRLNPFPGAVFGSINDAYIIPDVVVNEIDGDLVIRSTKRGTPSIEFQQTYFNRMIAKGDSEVTSYLNDRKREFEWIKKGVVYRGDTILRIAQTIVKYQTQFFTDQTRPIKPLLMKDIAKELDIHESTVSRSVNGKYMQTAFGTFELKTFFTTRLATKSGDDNISTDTAKQRVQAVVEQEDKTKPLSDQKIVELLKSQDILLSRRTVAKYRDELGIPSSSKRKRYEKNN